MPESIDPEKYSFLICSLLNSEAKRGLYTAEQQSFEPGKNYTFTYTNDLILIGVTVEDFAYTDDPVDGGNST